MALTLSSLDIVHLAALQESLLSPLDHDTVPAWCLACLRHAEALFHGDRSAMLVPLGGQLHYVSESISPELAARFQETLAQPESGALRFRGLAEDAAWGARRARRVELWNLPMLARLADTRLEETPGYYEYIRPAGITHGPVATTSLPTGEAFIGVADSRRADAKFNGERGLDLMALVLPAFKAGVRTLVRLEEFRGGFASVIDQLGQALVLLDLDGRELHETPRLRELLAQDAEGATVRLAARRLGATLADRRTGRRVGTHRQAAHTTRTATACYALSAAYLPGGLVTRGEVVVVSVDRLTPELPSAHSLITRHGLTHREAEVALFLAQGLPNMEIASRLGLSRHTVRHHAEWVFVKLGVHTRKALALTLLR